ncbi:hypothetical protein BpHYR1_041520 [Brachionus plicatilis]|uniref:Uncharacterized protein n=1 Tax=Brachionus plicatilis TaxID=10195 RepID=A0A3M7S3T8_BRAPC|nr:hypothetical protein BpHYR1_041520 [Brachionus plicatilis]
MLDHCVSKRIFSKLWFIRIFVSNKLVMLSLNARFHSIVFDDGGLRIQSFGRLNKKNKFLKFIKFVFLKRRTKLKSTILINEFPKELEIMID